MSETSSQSGAASAEVGLFGQRLRRFRERLEDAQGYLATLGLTDALKEVAPAARHEHFRMSVLGRFKTGKSTVINALLGAPYAPMDMLPCTSTVVEFRYGEKKRFFEHADGERIEREEQDFVSQAGGAADGHSDSTWEVQVPVEWLKPGFVLVDTPGTNEDEQRLEQANKELDRTDAAIVVVRADQVGGHDELDQIDELTDRVGIVVVVVNRIDVIKEKDRPRILAHVRKLVLQLGVPKERVITLSAAGALEGDEEAVRGLRALQESLSDVLTSDAAGARLASLHTQTAAAIRAVESKMDEKVQEAESKHAEAKAQVDQASLSIEETQAMRTEVIETFERFGKVAGEEAQAVLAEAWPKMLRGLSANRDRWDSAKNPLLSPEAFAREMGECAKRDLETRVRECVQNEVQPVIERTTALAQGELKGTVDPVLRVVALAGRGTAHDLGAEVFERAISDTFGKTLDAATADSAMSTTVTAAVSAAVGYVVADIILYFVLGVISGFLNPVLLTGAAIAGVAAWVLKGEAWLKSKVRNNIADALAKKLSADDVTEKVTGGAFSATQEAFVNLAHGTVRHLEQLIEETREDRRKHEVEAQLGAESAARITADRAEAKRSLLWMIDVLQETASTAKADQAQQSAQLSGSESP